MKLNTTVNIRLSSELLNEARAYGICVAESARGGIVEAIKRSKKELLE